MYFAGNCACLLFVPVNARAAVLANITEDRSDETVSETFTYFIDVRNPDQRLGIRVSARVIEGAASAKLSDVNGVLLQEGAVEGAGFVKVLEPPVPFTKLTLTLELASFRGVWSVTAVELPPKSEFFPFLLPGPLMVLIAAAALLYWRLRARAEWRWFLAGAALWAVGVAAKFAWAMPTNAFVLNLLESSLPVRWYHVIGSAYVGALTGVFEVGVTLCAALYWRKMTQKSEHAVAVGVGAGAVEAFLLGLGGMASSAAFFMAPAVSDIIMIANLQVAATTPAVWLCGPVERVLAMLCHVGSRVLTCYGVARGHYRYFALGFVLLSAVDTVAGWAHLTNSIGTISMWWIEFAILPFAFISWYATLWCIRHWPEKGPPLPAAEMALPFEQREAA